MGGVEIVGLFAEADPSASAPMWHSFAVDSSQWVPKHEVRRGAYAAVVRPGNIHRLHLSADPGRQPVRPDPGSNVFWESGLQVGATPWHLIAALGGLCNVDGAAPARAFGWQCPRRLTASHDLRVAPTVPGTEYGFWIACTWLPTADTAAAEAAALHLRDEFQQPAHLMPHRGSLVRFDARQERPAAQLALAGCFDRGLGAYRLLAEAGAVRITFDPGAVRRHRPVFLVEGVAAGASSEVVCTADGSQLEPGVDYRWQEWPAAAAAVLVQLRHDVTAPVTLELSCVPAAAAVSLRK